MAGVEKTIGGGNRCKKGGSGPYVDWGNGGNLKNERRLEYGAVKWVSKKEKGGKLGEEG